MTNAERQSLWRQNNPDRAKIFARERMRKLRADGREKPRGPRRNMLPFIALDGEGAGTDEMGRQNYQLLRAGDAGKFSTYYAICEDEKYIPTWKALEFILTLPREATLVGYFFGYDVTMILRDLPPDRLGDLFGDKSERRNKYTYWQSYGIEYLPRQYFRVCRINRETLRVIPNTSRTINETGGFFQKSFVEAIRDWKIGDPATVEMIAANKDRRSQFETIGAEENKYCAAECRLLAQLMERFREVCDAAGIVPRHWRGAGHISARLHELHKTPQRKNRKRPRIIEQLAEAAYYGGRFEVTTIGRVRGDIWEYDINSAYPAAMLQLPCPVHGKWKRIKGAAPYEPSEIYVADLVFSHPDRAFLAGFPIREKGRLYFPRMGSGVYWAPEIEAAKRIGASVSVSMGYVYIRKCDCRPFDWVNELYEYRKSIDKDTLGYPIKLGINGLYGKFAQRIGGAPWQDYVMAGLITSFTRAKLIDACAHAPGDILYIATDAVYSRKRLPLDIGNMLGQWEEKKRNGIFIVQPGIYWSNGVTDKPKTRGIPRSVVIEHRAEFENLWDLWLQDGANGEPPIVPVFVNQFIGIRAALARGRPELAGTWLSDLPEKRMRKIDYDWQSKRRPHGDHIRGECMVTFPYPGSPLLRSAGYDGSLITDFAAQLIDREDDPDFMPWGNSGE